MKKLITLSFALSAFTACSTSDTTSSVNQLIVCDTDPGTGVVLRCQPDDGGSGHSHSCWDVDTNGDGEPGDDNGTDSVAKHGADDAPGDDHGNHGGQDDNDHDGIPNDQDCDEHPGEDDHGGVDLPYDVRPALGSSTNPIADAFAAKGAQPASIVSVTMDGGDWRMSELTTGAPFIVTQADCDHQGNRDKGRDRIVVTWTNSDGSTDSDHLDLRYCK